MMKPSQALKSWTNWSAVLFVAVPEIWRLIAADPLALHIPDVWQHRIALAGAVAVILFRTANLTPPEPPLKPQDPPKS